MTDHGPSLLFVAGRPGTGNGHQQSLDDIRWFTIREAAAHCRRAPTTIRDLVSKHQLRRRTAWVTRKRLRRRVILLSPGVVRWLQQVTLFRDREALANPPTDHGPSLLERDA